MQNLHYKVVVESWDKDDVIRRSKLKPSMLVRWVIGDRKLQRSYYCKTCSIQREGEKKKTKQNKQAYAEAD